MELMTALAAAGDRAAALQHARVYEMILRQELDVAPEAQVVELAERLRTEEMHAPEAPTPVERSPASLPPTSGASVSAPNADAAVNDSEPMFSGPPPSRWRIVSRRGTIIASIGAAVTVAVSIGLIRLTNRPGPVTAQKDLIALAPCRVSGADPTLAFLGEGLVDLLTTKLTDAGTTQPVDAGSVIAAWHSAGAAKSGASRDVVLNFARRLRAEHLLLGSVVGAPAHVVISASLLNVADGSVSVQASVEGPSDSLTAMVDRLVARLVAQAAGMSERLANHTTTSLRALRAYLDGLAAYRRGAYLAALEHFRSALESDPSFRWLASAWRRRPIA